MRSSSRLHGNATLLILAGERYDININAGLGLGWDYRTLLGTLAHWE